MTEYAAGSPVVVTGQGVAGVPDVPPWGGAMTVQGIAGATAVPVSLAAVPQPSQIAGLKAGSIFQASLAAAATAVVVAAAPGKTVTVWGYTWGMNPTVAASSWVHLEDSAGTVIVDSISSFIATLVGNVAASSHNVWIPGGYALGLGLGVRVRNDVFSAGAIAAVGTLWYTQA